MKRLIILGALILMSFGSYAHAFTPDIWNRQHSGETRPTLAVKNSDGDHIGTIRDALMDPFGYVPFVIVSFDHQVAGKNNIIVPVDALTLDKQDGTVTLNMSEDLIAAAPEFSSTGMKDPSFVERVYRFYAQKPPWSDQSEETRPQME